MLGNVLFKQSVRGIVFDECVNVDLSHCHFEGYVHDPIRMPFLTNYFRIFGTIFPICALTTECFSQMVRPGFFLPPYAAAGIRTHISRVAPSTRDLYSGRYTN